MSQISRSKIKLTQHCKGAVFVEFCFTIVVIMLFIAGVSEFGKLFSKLSNLSTSAYNSVLIGGEQSEEIVVASTESIFKTLWSFQSSLNREIEITGYSASVVPGSPNNLIRLSIDGEIKSEIFDFKFPLNMSVTGSILRLSPQDTTGGGGLSNPSTVSMGSNCSRWGVESQYKIGCVGPCC